MEHTPGPWRVGPEDWIISKQYGMGWRQFPIRGKDYDVANVFCDEDDAEHAANVRLVAAAPDLLKALHLADNALDYAQAQVDSERDAAALRSWRRDIQAAIAKATTEEVPHG